MVTASVCTSYHKKMHRKGFGEVGRVGEGRRERSGLSEKEKL